MITKFDSSYYGTADMENLGYRGTPINDRCYSKEELAKALHKVVAYAKCMDERDYNTFWMAEHHFQPEGTELIPNLLMMAMHLVNVTKNLRIGCCFNIVHTAARAPSCDRWRATEGCHSPARVKHSLIGAVRQSKDPR